VGGARTALFNWLLARRHGGAFILRIEDTDVERSSDEMVDGILDGMRWLGLDWDEGPGVGGPHAPYFQSERQDIYRQEVDRLVEQGSAYYCYCTPDEIKAKRDAAEAAGGAWRYDRTCERLTAAEVAEREREGRPRAVRIRVPNEPMAFDDLVHGRIEFDGSNLDDFIVMRSDGHPTYHLTVVSDDVRMKITHVVRGDDHISNTPKQLVLYRALGAAPPLFAHVPLILGSDKKRLSKRHGATSVMAYASQGYLPEAMVNFLALLGWSPGSGNREVFLREDLSETFSLEGISTGDAVFNVEKLEWFNQQHLMRLTPDALMVRLQPWFEAAGLWDPAFAGEKRMWFLSVLEQLKPRAKRLSEFAELGRYFFVDELEIDDAAAARHLRADGMAEHLQALSTAFAALPSLDVSSAESALRGVAAARGVKAAALIHAVRVALTGRTASPGLFEVAALLGRERVLQRIDAAISLATSSRIG
jgi:glutamyl-tRNA synthetase